MLSICAAFAGPLLKPLNQRGFIIHWVGDSSSGKSTAAEVGASVWGPPEFVRSWNATANGLEGVATIRNDTCLILDEISEASPKECGKIAYMVANGQGKQRAGKAGNARNIRRWRTVGVSTGERTLEAFLAGAKLPSIKASDQSNCPRWSNSARNARHALSHTPCSSQSFSRRQHVEGLGYSLGKSAHGAPVRKTQRIPSNTLRLSIQGRPPRFDFRGLGNNCSIFFHCVSVSFERSFAIENTPFNDKVGITRSKTTL